MFAFSNKKSIDKLLQVTDAAPLPPELIAYIKAEKREFAEFIMNKFSRVFAMLLLVVTLLVILDFISVDNQTLMLKSHITQLEQHLKSQDLILQKLDKIVK